MLFATYDTHLLMYAYIVYASEINNNLKRNKKKKWDIYNRQFESVSALYETSQIFQVHSNIFQAF